MRNTVVAPSSGPGSSVAVGASAPSSFEAATSSPVDAKLSQLRGWMNGHTDRGEEKQILEMLRAAPAGELNQMLCRLSRNELHALMGDMDNHLLGPQNHDAFVSLLSKERLGELSIDSRARVIDALQRHATGSKDEAAVRDIFLGTQGAALTALKNAVDAGGDYHDLQQLVFHDIDNAGIRSQLLEHFRSQAQPTGQVKVLSDIDDTFYANLKDDRYPGKTVYPGVKAFYSELDKGAGPTADREGDLTFISARPYDRAGFAEGLTRAMLDENGLRDATVLSGDFLHLIGNSNIADKKFDNWQEYRQLFPEYKSVFIGDSGQGDAIFGAKAVATAPSDMKAVFIHNVTNMSADERKAMADKGVFIFDTYVGAATEAFRRGLITREGLERVAAATSRELDAVPFESFEQHAARRTELERDLAEMRAVLGKSA
ncbi:phosphatase domain-containing protein [Hyalangium gracile]|uniref:phosphatase domain-containing protein n=1 Tax=Hyalangium gracile TaxID=394092 RepID=UPI001CC981B1|nr:phosphatase domain-containing protein [Hyalangium gracile]